MTTAKVRPAEFAAAAELRASLRRFLRRSEQATRAHRLTPERYDLLLAIKGLATKGLPAGASGPTVAQLAETLQLAQSSVTQLVRRARDDGLLEREVSARDGRVHYLRVTPEGERRLAGAVAALRVERKRLSAALAHLNSPRR